MLATACLAQSVRVVAVACLMQSHKVKQDTSFRGCCRVCQREDTYLCSSIFVFWLVLDIRRPRTPESISARLLTASLGVGHTDGNAPVALRHGNVAF